MYGNNLKYSRERTCAKRAKIDGSLEAMSRKTQYCGEPP